VMQIQRRISKQKRKAQVGREYEILLEGPSEESELLLEGRTRMHAPEIDGKVFVNDVPPNVKPQSGQFYRCVISEAHDYDLVAKIV
jgi:ribosomal protein S12 methylthiotransferase